MIGIILLGLFTWLAVHIVKFYVNVARYPKGPTPLPFVGNILQLDPQKPHATLGELTKTYGPVFTIFMPRPIVVLMKYEIIKEAFGTKGEDFSGRSNSFPDDLFLNIENGGVIFSQGATWKENRREALHILRDFGMGKNLMEELIKDTLIDMQHCIDKIDKSNGLNLRMPIQMFVSNIINQTLFGVRQAFDEHTDVMKCSESFAAVSESLRKDASVFIALSYPWVQRIPYIGDHIVNRHRKLIQPMKDYIEKEVARVLKTYNPADEPTCFTQAYYQKMHNNPAASDVYAQAQNMAMDFFLAGMETTSTTLRWASLYLTEHQEVQEKCRAEILKVIGTERLPSMADKARMPYTQAVILEVQRKANIVGLNVMHRTERDTSVAGYRIPDDTLVVGQIHHTMSSDDYFENPEKFDPERFLTTEGTLNKEAAERMVAFSIGKRVCAGEGLAKFELFLGLTFLLQKYKFSPRSGKKIDLTPIFGTVLLPKPHALHVESVEAA